jgi:hypothetical protein
MIMTKRMKRGSQDKDDDGDPIITKRLGWQWPKGCEEDQKQKVESYFSNKLHVALISKTSP